MKQNIEYGRKRLREIVENEARQEEERTKDKKKQTDDDVDLTLTSRRGNWKELTKALWYLDYQNWTLMVILVWAKLHIKTLIESQLKEK